MAVKIRLRRLGKKKRPFYRFVAIDSRMPREGRFLETLGHYNPIEKPATVKIVEDRLAYWLDQGAVMSSTVHHLLAQVGFTKKYELMKAGKDVSEITVREQITERPKKNKRSKGDKTEAVAAEAGGEAKAEEKVEAKAEEKAEVKAEEKAEEKTEEASEDKAE